eukprot:CAMPEP_0116869908 /NCGR_PEP_ID=MMETSP0418-20121206/28012_1 /TAXON_ID=1158023 /ORGANISM="Astrosyne radiata, Strain 13vi08-1A" /LENGTH=167 /DNA_ID=CAMNT_0004506039 /DNA_START=131 /DNA_END=634 /DNA_ORIENTATION=+
MTSFSLGRRTQEEEVRSSISSLRCLQEDDVLRRLDRTANSCARITTSTICRPHRGIHDNINLLLPGDSLEVWPLNHNNNDRIKKNKDTRALVLGILRDALDILSEVDQDLFPDAKRPRPSSSLAVNPSKNKRYKTTEVEQTTTPHPQLEETDSPAPVSKQDDDGQGA